MGDQTDNPDNQLDQPHLIAVLPASQLWPTDDGIAVLVSRALNVEPPSLLQDALEVAAPFPLSKRVAVHRNMPYFVELYRYLTQTRDLSRLSGITVYQSDAPELARLRTTSARFTPGVVHAAHPVAPGVYIPLASFHDYLVDEKHNELIELLGALGAKSVEFFDEHERRTDVGAHATVAGQGAGEVTGARSRKMAIANTLTFSAPGGPPRAPVTLRWYRYERAWQALATLRTDGRLASYDLNFEYLDDFAVNAKLVAKVNGLGLECGGHFRTFESIRRHLRITFFD